MFTEKADTEDLQKRLNFTVQVLQMCQDDVMLCGKTDFFSFVQL